MTDIRDRGLMLDFDHRIDPVGREIDDLDRKMESGRAQYKMAWKHSR